MWVLRLTVLCSITFVVANGAHITKEPTTEEPTTEEPTTEEPTTEEPEAGLKWPTEYYFKGEIADVFNGISEPFEIWYSKKLDRSRMDVFNGIVKKYYWPDREKYVTIYPTYSIGGSSISNCEYAPYEDDPYNILPTDLEWTLTGTGTFNGEPTRIWEADWEKNTTISHYTTTTRTEGGFDIPLRLEILGSKIQSGMTVKHLNAIFSDYKSPVEEENVDIENFDDDCSFNPNVAEGLHHLRHYIASDVNVAYDRYKDHHEKKYSENEHEMRKEIFEMNWRRVDSHNRKNLGYKLELNQFADWTEDELANLRGTRPPKEVDPGTHPFLHTLEEIDAFVENLPEFYDLRLEGDLPPIKDQQTCGSCWAFATTATVEAAVIKYLGNVQLDLSEQSVVDCAWGYGSYGCYGGFLDGALKYVKENGIPTEGEYGGYMHENGYCHVKNMSQTYKIKGYTMVTPHSVNALKYAVYTYGAIAVTMHASDDLLLYSSGVFYDMTCKNKRLNHAVVVVGYGSKDGETYWIVRNSYGETWGEDGYVLMSAKDNNCLIMDAPYYPIV